MTAGRGDTGRLRLPGPGRVLVDRREWSNGLRTEKGNTRRSDPEAA